MKQPHRGCLAVCSRGSLGLITSDGPINIKLAGNPDYVGWTGIQVSPSQESVEKAGRVVGDTWCSSRPVVVLTAEELRVMAQSAVK